MSRAAWVKVMRKTVARTMVLAASKGERVEAMTERRQRMRVMTSRLQSGQLRGSSGLSLGCGTRMVPSLLCLTLLCRGA